MTTTRFSLKRQEQQTVVGETKFPDIVTKVIEVNLREGRRGFGDRALRLGASIRTARGHHATDDDINAAVQLGETLAAQLRAARALHSDQRPSLIAQFIPDND